MGDYILIDGEFIITPRILFNDKNLSRTDIDVLSLIISLTLKNNFCFASNNYLANYISISVRTITNSLSKLKRLKYIIIRYNNNNRRIYLNTEKIPIKSSNKVASNCKLQVEDNYDHNINNKYKNKYNHNKPIIPDWMKNPEMCKSNQASPEEISEMEELLKKYR